MLSSSFKCDSQHRTYRRDLPAAAVDRLTNALAAIERSGELAKIRARYGLD